MHFPNSLPVRAPYGSAADIPETVGALCDDPAFIAFVEA